MVSPTRKLSDLAWLMILYGIIYCIGKDFLTKK